MRVMRRRRTTITTYKRSELDVLIIEERIYLVEVDKDLIVDRNFDSPEDLSKMNSDD